MKKARILSFLLSLTMLVSAAVPSTMALPVYADEAETDKGLEISKTAKKNDDGSYTITLEAYATGKKISTEVTKDVPTDIVLVLDQSGSMDEEDFPSAGETTYEAYTGYETRNSNLYNNRHNNNGDNGNLYYQFTDGSYATVSVERIQGEGSANYTECPENWQNEKSGSWGDYNPDDYWKYANNLYVKNNEGKYEKVTLTRKGTTYDLPWGESYEAAPYTYTYTFPDGATVVSEGDEIVPNFGDKGPLYYVSASTPGEYTYTYTCTDADGNTIDIGTSTGENTWFTDATLYRRNVTNGGNITRLQALKNAVTGFKNSVAQKAAGKDGVLGTEDDVDHRIAVVGFASGTYYNHQNYNYGNTEVFVGANQYKYGTNAQAQYGNALQSMKTQNGQNNVTASIGALAADGGTIINLGLEMANGILDANPVPDGEKRNRVIVVFTDGTPGWNGYDGTVANNAIAQANTARSKGANVYSVGIFNGADATSAGNQNGNDTQKANWFMQNLSDNKGTPQTPSYYLSASDSNTLNNIFQQISDNIESGGSLTELDSSAVIKDIISPQFQLPAGATEKNITLETWKYIGENQWENNNDALDAAAIVNGNQVSVTGFDFKENWCGTETKDNKTTYRGNKLVISFTVEVKDGFLGGNGVYTNENAGVYENNDANIPLFPFERPQVDVPIGSVNVTAEDKNVYLMSDLTAEQIKSGATVSVENVKLDLNKENYGLESWQTDYVNISVSYKDKDGNEITNLSDLKDDTTYKVSVNVSPKKIEGTATEQTGNDDGNINVFKPELTYKDSEVYYGDTAPTDFSENLVSTAWKHGETASTNTDVTMIGDVPELTMDYAPDETKISDNKINTKQDVPVDVTVKIGENDVTQNTTFQHRNCEGKTCTVPEDKEFLLHVKTCQLTVTKEGGADKEPYVFDIMKDGKKYTEVTIEGNNSATICELPVGEYTIKENENWSWRYLAKNGNGVTLSSTNTSAGITCTNSRKNDSWLNGYSSVMTNTAGVANSSNNN